VTHVNVKILGEDVQRLQVLAQGNLLTDKWHICLEIKLLAREGFNHLLNEPLKQLAMDKATEPDLQAVSVAILVGLV
jgi:hypothetical protein